MITLPLVWPGSVLTTIAAFALAQDTRMPFPVPLSSDPGEYRPAARAPTFI
jgi:hypothetical protein